MEKISDECLYVWNVSSTVSPSAVIYFWSAQALTPYQFGILAISITGPFTPDWHSDHLCSAFQRSAFRSSERPFGIPFFHVLGCTLMALCQGLPRWAGTRMVKPIWIFLKQETVNGSGISWAICKSAPRPRHYVPAAITEFFTGRCPTNSIKALNDIVQ